MATGKFCIRTSVNFWTFRNHIFAILKDMTPKLGHFINFKVLFPAVSENFPSPCYISKFACKMISETKVYCTNQCDDSNEGY